jgi:hypothetical protein
MHFKTALNNGWKLAPTVSEDNKSYITPATPRRTGVWSQELTSAGIMEALHARRIFASDDVNFQLSVFADGQWMGSTIPQPENSIVKFRIEWSDPDDPISAVWLVKKPGEEIALDLTGKNLYSDTLVVSQPVTAGEWYFVKVKQSDNNLIFSAPIWIEPLPIVVEAGADVEILPGESIQLSAAVSNGIAPYSYSWTPAESLDDATSLQPLAKPPSTTTYTLTVTDAVGETGSDTITIIVR